MKHSQKEKNTVVKFFHTSVTLIKSISKTYIIQLFLFIDWIMELPQPLELQYTTSIQKIEEKKYMRYILTFFMTLCASAALLAQEPSPNLQLYKQALIRYYDSGDYNKDLLQIEKQAEGYLNQRLEENRHHPNPKKLAMVFDIDETVLSNIPLLKANDLSFPLDIIHKNQVKANDPAIPAMLDLYHNAIKQQVAVFFVTGRKEKLRETTAENLKIAGFNEWKELFLKPSHYNLKSVANFKTAARENIEKQGYDIVINIGDQQSDLIGGHADKIFKLPNPYYYVP